MGNLLQLFELLQSTTHGDRGGLAASGHTDYCREGIFANLDTGEGDLG